MSTPDPPAPPPAPLPPPKKRNNFLIGCLVVLLLLVLGGVAVVVLGIYAAKNEYDKLAPDARKAYDQAREAAASAEEASRLAPTLAQGAQAQARLATAAHAVADASALTPAPCPPDPARVSIPVDAEWFGQLASGVPEERVGTPWMRHRVFQTLADEPFDQYVSDENMALAEAAADRDLSDAGTVAVIHTTTLKMPKALDANKFEGGHFEGFVQLLKYPSGDSICVAPFSADSSESVGGGLGIGLRVRGISIPVTGAMPKKEPQQQVEEDFQGRFWQAEEAALGK